MSRRVAKRVRARSRARGVGLVEVLLAVVLTSIGFLAAARMQVQGMTTAQNAYALSQAKFMVLDMSERMRVNRGGLKGGAYRTLATSADATAPDCMASAESCSPADIALADLAAWSAHLHAPDGAIGFVPLLPSAPPGVVARGRIAHDAATDVHTVSVTWAERDAGGTVSRTITVEVAP